MYHEQKPPSIVDLNIKLKSINLLKENLYDLDLGRSALVYSVWYNRHTITWELKKKYFSQFRRLGNPWSRFEHIKVWADQCLVRACFPAHRWCLFTISLSSKREKELSKAPFTRALIPFMRPEFSLITSQRLHLLSSLCRYYKIWTWGDASVQSIALRNGHKLKETRETWQPNAMW